MNKRDPLSEHYLRLSDLSSLLTRHWKCEHLTHISFKSSLHTYFYISFSHLETLETTLFLKVYCLSTLQTFMTFLRFGTAEMQLYK